MAATEEAVAAGAGVGGGSEARKIVDIPVDFELDTYLSAYQGRTRVERLRFIGGRAPDEHPLRRVALEQAVKEAKELTLDVGLYESALGSLLEYYETHAEIAPEERVSLDVGWVDATKRKVKQEVQRLEAQVNTARTQMVRENIRMGYNDLAAAHKACGELTLALKCYIRSREYTSSPQHQLEMCLNVVETALLQKSYNTVNSYQPKARKLSTAMDPVSMGKLMGGGGLAQAALGNYKQAARNFVETPVELGEAFNRVLAPQDIAIYGGLCALASLDRQELKTLVIDSPTFRQYLELAPNVRELIHDFYMARYESCLTYLEQLKPYLELDMFIQPHIQHLYAEIRRRGIIQYFSPFLSVDMTRMADAFVTTVDDIEQEVAHLITHGQLQARIDSHNKVLYARYADQRAATYRRAIQLGNQYKRSTKALLFRVNLVRSKFVLKDPSGGSLRARMAAGPGPGLDVYSLGASGAAGRTRGPRRRRN